MEEEGVLIGYSEFSIFQRLFGRSAGEMVSVVAGSVCFRLNAGDMRGRLVANGLPRIALAIVSLVLTAISLSKETDPYLITSDSLFLAASAVQILAFVAGWGAVLTAGAAAGSESFTTRISPLLNANLCRRARDARHCLYIRGRMGADTCNCCCSNWFDRLLGLVLQAQRFETDFKDMPESFSSR